MRRIKILDCTLRDGGYCNNWIFGENRIGKIIDAIIQSKVDMVEYGYWDKRRCFDIHSTRIPCLNQVPDRIRANGLVMINYGETDIDTIPQNRGDIWGIRVAFHKKEKKEALLFCRKLKEKGYQVLIQPMVTCSYLPDEFCDMLHEANEIMPHAFYIVDSFGSMQDDEMEQYAQAAEELLDNRIGIGFHGHDNLQRAFQNAEAVICICKKHPVYLDSTIMGMGRGAGNLKTEDILEYCNQYLYADYYIEPVLKARDEVVSGFYREHPWGYTLPLDVAARHHCHPKYAQYLDGKKGLSVNGLNEIFGKIAEEKKYYYDKQYMEKVYSGYVKENLG